MKGVVYLILGFLLSVRSALVEMRMRRLRPCESRIVADTKFGCHFRFV